MTKTNALKDYFATAQGSGILSTANAKGEVSSAVYAKPHFLEDGTLAFIMRERHTWANLEENPSACYLFVEHGHLGKRLYLTKVASETNSERLFALRRRRCDEESPKEKLHLVSFRLDAVRPLVGG